MILKNIWEKVSNMKKLGKKHEDLMRLLDQVPGVEDHMESFEVIMGQKILQRRIELGLTQSQLVERICAQGDRITQATISKVETGDGTVGSDTYNKIFKALGRIASLDVNYGGLPKSTQRELVLA